jgi:O-glycosyl hydrolase
MRKALAGCAATLTLLSLLPSGPVRAGTPAEQHITLDGRGTGKVFDGVGAVSAGGSSRLLYDYPQRERAQILDYLFKPGYGASLQVLKIEIGGDIDATVGAEPSHERARGEVDCTRGYEWWLAREAVRRNPQLKLYALAWGAPGWLDGGFFSGDYIDYLISWLGCARRNGLRVDYLGGSNERGYDRDFYVRLAAALDRAGYAAVKVVASDDHSPPDYWAIARQMRADPQFADAVDVLGEHDVCVWRTAQRYCVGDADAQALGKPMWDSENSTQDYDVGALPLARAMNRHYIDAGVTGNLNWALVSSWYDNFPIAGTGMMLADRPWSGSYQVGPIIWVDAHTTQFTRPGWRYIDSASGYLDSGASYVTLRSPDTEDYSVVVETTDATAPQTVRLRPTGGLDAGPVQLWSTDLSTVDTSDDFRHLGAVRPRDGSVTVTLQPGHLYTISTLTGQAKGGARPDAGPADQLPVPYREDFERTATGRPARYFADVHGAFEAAPCAGGRRGTCYRQVVDVQPHTWHNTNPPPTTMVGDPRWWGDYRVGVDALLEQPGHVELLGRVDSQQHNAAGYHLRLSDQGAWTLYKQDASTKDTTLAAGTVAAPGTGTWHRLELRFHGEQVSALLDGATLTTVRDADHTTGQVGVRVSQWQTAQFDNLSVVPTAAWPRFVPHAAMTATATSEHAGNDAGHTYPASHAVDDRIWSQWRSEYSPPAPLPQSITLDLGRIRGVHAVVYTPPVPAGSGSIAGYTIEVSADGRAFHRVAAGRWADTLATKTASWDRPALARYVRMTVTGVYGCPATVPVAELNVSTTPVAALGHGGPDPDPGPQFPNLVPQGQMSATTTSFQPGYEPGKALDGDCSTMWHTSWSPYQPPPQSITLDLGADYRTVGLAYQPRQDGNPNGVVTGYEVSTSTDGQTFTRVAGGTWAADDTTKDARWPATPARYVRLDAVQGGGGYVSAAELNVAYED